MTKMLALETSGNKGEWSEIYSLIKLLADGRIYAANEELERMNPEIYLPIIKIRREESNEIYDYHTADTQENTVKIFHNDVFIKAIPVEEFKTQTALLCHDLIHCGKGTIKLSELKGLKEFLNNIFVNKIKADNQSKADIVIEFIDVATGIKPLAGFSIKSQMGAASTLLNASSATNFTYKITGIDDDIMNEVNSVNSRTKIIDRIRLLRDYNAKISFSKVDNEVFADNLEMLDSRMSEILSFVLLYRFRDNIKQTIELMNKICRENPMHFHNNKIYTYKYKQLLFAVALGMVPASAWNGREEASGGYVIVKNDGDILVYYHYNRNCFEDYLLRTTYLEAASTSRHHYANVYKENGEYYIKLNLQIRFNANQ